MGCMTLDLQVHDVQCAIQACMLQDTMTGRQPTCLLITYTHARKAIYQSVPLQCRLLTVLQGAACEQHRLNLCSSYQLCDTQV